MKTGRFRVHLVDEAMSGTARGASGGKLESSRREALVATVMQSLPASDRCRRDVSGTTSPSSFLQRDAMWRRGLVVARWSRSAKLLYAGPG